MSSSDLLYLLIEQKRWLWGGWKGVDAAAVTPTNNDDARVVHFSLPMAQ